MATAGSGIDIQEVRERALGCTKCRLSETRTQVVWAAGNLDSDVLFIGEAPGFHEDKQGEPFVGAAGKLLDTLLGEIELDRTKVAIVNVIKCRPPGNRDPQPDEIESCKPYLDAQVGHMKPRVIVTLGNFATRFILESPIGITKARGRYYAVGDALVVPTFHPAAALRGGRFGEMTPVDAIRADFKTVRWILDGGPEANKTQEAEASADETEDGSDSEQLGLW